jgi:hypothetical protein
LQSAVGEAQASAESVDAMLRCLLGQLISEYLKTRSVSDVQAELLAAAENVDPDTDYVFMRP